MTTAISITSAAVSSMLSATATSTSTSTTPATTTAYLQAATETATTTTTSPTLTLATNVTHEIIHAWAGANSTPLALLEDSIMHPLLLLANGTTLNDSATGTPMHATTEISINDTLRLYPGYVHYHDKYDLSYIAKVNPFWLQFEPPETRTFYIMAILYAIITVIGCIGNAFVIFMFSSRKPLRTPANILVSNLAVCDFLMLIKCPIAIYNNIKEGPALGDVACRIYGFVGGMTGTAAIGTLTAIALDRYNVVVHPLEPLRSSSKLRSYLVICLIWCYSFIFSVMPALDIGLSVYVPEGFLTTCSFDYLNKETPARIFMALFFVAAYCIPLTTIMYSYFYILKVVFRANHIQSNKDKAKTEQKLTFIVAAIIGLWFIAWSPYAIVAMMGVFGLERYITPLGSMIPALFCKTAACIDPYLYAATHPRFRVEVRMLIYGHGVLRRVSTTRSSYITRSSFTRRSRSGDDKRHPTEPYMNNNLMMVPEETEENEEIIVVAEINHEQTQTIQQTTK